MTTAKIFYERNYKLKGSSFQRLYPNEELCRFIGRNFKKFSNIKKKNIKILEVGIGNATNLVMLGKEGFKIYGIDISEEAIKISRKTLAQSNLKSELKQSDMTNFNFHLKFDCIVDIFSSYCLDNKNFKIFLENIHKNLNKDGIFFSYIPSKSSFDWKNEKNNKFDSCTLNSISKKNSIYYGNNYKFKFLSRKEYIYLLKKKGFKIKYFETVRKSYSNMKKNYEFLVVEAKK